MLGMLATQALIFSIHLNIFETHYVSIKARLAGYLERSKGNRNGRFK